MSNRPERKFDFIDEQYQEDNEHKSKFKGKKRKWREIEMVKEQRRLKKELHALDCYYD